MSADELRSQLQVPSWCSSEIVLKINGKNDASVWGEAAVDGRVVAQLAWSPEGKLLHEKAFGPDGRPNGLEIQYDGAGRVIWCARWVAGEMHGMAMQFDDEGLPVIATPFVHGDGVDVWIACGEVSEVRATHNGIPHGLVRWGNPTKPDEEGYFANGKRHGIFRCWEGDVMESGYPAFYVNDNQVSEDRYRAACDVDCSLPPYNESEDTNERSMPASVRDALDRASLLRNGFSLASYLEKERRIG
jgi:antitoxin component YwqK of YwqJK toxin-antitoxin module